jgi:hypothetical protein
MARAAWNSFLETRTVRARLRIRRAPYFAKNRERSAALREGSYAVADAVKDYLAEIKAKSPMQGAKYAFDARILPELGAIQIEKLATDCIDRWRDKLATQPKRVRSKRTAMEPATRATADDLPILRACARQRSSVQL